MGFVNSTGDSSRWAIRRDATAIVMKGGSSPLMAAYSAGVNLVGVKTWAGSAA